MPESGLGLHKFTLYFICHVSILFFNAYCFAEEHSHLTQKEAQTRFKQVSEVSYKISVDLTKADYRNGIDDAKNVKNAENSPAAEYSSQVTINFKVNSRANEFSQFIFLDFALEDSDNIESIFLNNKIIQYQWNDIETKLMFPVSIFKLGQENQLTITFTNEFSSDGAGFSRSVDSEDKSVYVFTDFEPYDANLMFPLFDQPDLKATFELETIAPNDWHVFSNAPEKEKVSVTQETTQWVFYPTDKISSYVFALVAGPFHIWTSQTENGIPLRIMSRKTLAKYVDPIVSDWFQITQKALNFYSTSFDYPYPFKKYDQVLLPDLASEAMENVGIVTFREDYIRQRKMLPSERMVFARVINHEMAHMWFGNLVTMKWWDDLWLNESFATFASFLTMEALSKELGYVEPWQNFNAKIKKSAYIEDSYKKTTHSVVGDAQDTREASFDDITYNKGAAVLKQLYFYIGKDNFFKGLRSYFKKYAFQNTTRSDFLQTLSESYGADLSEWDAQWLETKGHNSVKVDVLVKDDKISKLSIIQFPDPMEHRLRSHRSHLGFYDQNDNGEFVLREVIDVQYSQSSTEIPEAIGKKMPAFIIINSGDYDFVQEILDEKTINLLQNQLYKIKDPLLKQQLYFMFWNMVRENQHTAKYYIKLVENNIPFETDISVLEMVLSTLKPSLLYVDAQKRSALNDEIASFLLKRMHDESNKILRRMFYLSFLEFAHSKNHLKIVEFWFRQEAGFTQAEKWELISVLARGGYPNSLELIQSELKKDASIDGLLSAQIAESSIPDLNFKKAWFDNLATPHKINFGHAHGIMANFHDPINENLTQFVEEFYFDAILELEDEDDIDIKIAAFASAMYPISYSQDFAEKSEQFVHTYNDILSGVIKHAVLKQVEDSHKIRQARLMN